MSTTNQIQGPKNIVDFVTAGNSTFTIVSKRTGVRHTYKVQKTDNNPNAFFCNLMTGSDNNDSFTFIGMLYLNNGNRVYKEPKAPKIDMTLNSVTGFKWFIENMHKAQLSNHISFFHEGRCCHCNKKLTTPESILTGWGPICRKRNTSAFLALAA